MHVDRVHHAREVDPGQAGHEEQIILAGLVFECRVHACFFNAQTACNLKAFVIMPKSNRAKTKKLIFEQDRK